MIAHPHAFDCVRMSIRAGAGGKVRPHPAKAVCSLSAVLRKQVRQMRGRTAGEIIRIRPPDTLSNCASGACSLIGWLCVLHPLVSLSKEGGGRPKNRWARWRLPEQG